MSSLSNAAAITLVVLLTGAARAAPFTVAECVAASDEGQLLQQRGALLAARQSFERCSHASCPALVQGACTKWLDEVLTATPSLIIVARLEGVDRPAARVLLDGEPWLGELTGKPQPVDPGEHRITVEVDGPAVEQRLVVNVGEKNRLVVFQLVPPVRPPVAALAARPRAAPVLPLVLTGTTLAGLATFTALGLTGRSAQARLTQSECAKTKTCDPSSVASIQQLYGGADFALVLGVASAAAATWQWFVWAQPSEVSLTPLVAPSGAGVMFSGAW